MLCYNQLVYGSGLSKAHLPHLLDAWEAAEVDFCRAWVDSSWLDRLTFVELRISQYVSSIAVLGDIAMSMAISTTA